MTNLSRVRKIEGLWVVEILSTVTGTWIVQGEWKTQAEADADRRNWLN